jgi:hypothetical protein
MSTLKLSLNYRKKKSNQRWSNIPQILTITSHHNWLNTNKRPWDMTLEFQVLFFGQAQWYGGAKPVNVKKTISYLAKYYKVFGQAHNMAGLNRLIVRKHLSYLTKCYNVFVSSIYTLTFYYFDKITPIKDL